jgi:hypothetical protein
MKSRNTGCAFVHGRGVDSAAIVPFWISAFDLDLTQTFAAKSKRCAPLTRLASHVLLNVR